MKKIFLIITFIALSMGIYSAELVPTITMNGVGNVEVTPDIAYISFGITNTGKDLSPLKKENDRLTKKVVETLFKSGVAKEDIYTSNYNISHHYNYQTEGENKEKVYTVTNQMKLTVENIEAVGDLINLLEENGVNTVQGINYTTTKQEELKLQALKRAYLDAKKSAESIAKLEGYKIEVLSITPLGSIPRPELYMASDSVKRSNSIYNPSDISINANITVVFKLIK